MNQKEKKRLNEGHSTFELFIKIYPISVEGSFNTYKEV